jgi:hypothetical protein
MAARADAQAATTASQAIRACRSATMRQRRNVRSSRKLIRPPPPKVKSYFLDKTGQGGGQWWHWLFRRLKQAATVDFLDEIIAFTGVVLLAFAFGASSLPLVRFKTWLHTRFHNFEVEPLVCRDCPPLVPDVGRLPLAAVNISTHQRRSKRMRRAMRLRSFYGGPSALSSRETLSTLPFRRGERTRPGRLSLAGPFIKGPRPSASCIHRG